MVDARPDKRACSGHIPGLDGLRGLAILMVMLMHFTDHQQTNSSLVQVLNRILGCGWIGVDLFFVLSGFLITGILIDTKNTPRYFLNFFARRSLRIFPLYYGYVCVLLFCVVPFVQRTGYMDSVNVQVVADNKPYFLLYGTNFLLAQRGHFLTGFVDHLWSLAIEEHFYFLWPFVVYFVGKRHLAAVCWTLIVGAIMSRAWFVFTGVWPLSAYLLTPCRMDALAIGGLAAICARSPEILNSVMRLSKPGLWIGGGYVLFYFGARGVLPWVGVTYEVVGKSVTAFFFALCLLGIVNARDKGLTSRAFSHPLLCFFGRYSYGLYVFHTGVWLIKMRFGIPQYLEAHSIPAFLVWFVDLLIPMIFSILIAFCSWHLFEKQVLKLKRFFEYQPQG